MTPTSKWLLPFEIVATIEELRLWKASCDTPTCNDMHVITLKDLDSRIKGNISKTDDTVMFSIFHG
jgi:hypothetical protein